MSSNESSKVFSRCVPWVFSGVLQGVILLSSRGILQGCPPRVSSGVSSRGVLQGCPHSGSSRCPPRAASKGVLQGVTRLYRRNL
jgi:hypothetical protein